MASTLRTAYALIIPFALLLPVIALDLSQRRWSATAPAGRACRDFAVSLALFAPGLVLFTTHYLMLRGFYALERTRTVFWVQCVIAATNIVLAVAAHQPRLAVGHRARAWCSPTPAPTWSARSASYSLLRRVLGGLETPRAGPLPGPAADRGRDRRRGRLGGEVRRPAGVGPAGGRGRCTAAAGRRWCSRSPAWSTSRCSWSWPG